MVTERAGEMFSVEYLLVGWSDLMMVTESSLGASRKALILLAFFGVVVLGILMILVVWLSGRIARRYMNRPVHQLPRDSTRSMADDAWAQRPLVPASENEFDEEESSSE